VRGLQGVVAPPGSLPAALTVVRAPGSAATETAATETAATETAAAEPSHRLVAGVGESLR